VSKFYLVAKIISASADEGFVNISLFTDFPKHLYKLKKVYIDFFNDKKEFEIDKVKSSKDKFKLKLKKFNNKSDIEILLGKEIFISEKNLLKLPENQYYIHDLIGSRVLKNNDEVGMIKDVISLPANDVYVVKDKSGNEVLIPAVSDYVDSFIPEKKVMYLKSRGELYDTDED
jgi:16S rRNA processing protein RimM